MEAVSSVAFPSLPSSPAIVATHEEVCFNFFGYCISLQCNDTEVREAIIFDLSSFRTPSTLTHCQIEVRVAPAAIVALPAIPATVHSIHFFRYDTPEYSVIDYHGEVRVLLSADKSRALVVGPDRTLIAEKLFLLTLSLAGQGLDAQGLHRVHALGFSFRGNGYLLLVPPYGGKSTLAHELLKHPDIKILSEESPLLDRRSQLHPFPLRFGFRTSAAIANIPQEFLRRSQRSGWGEKILVRTEYFGKAIARSAVPLRGIILGSKIGSGRAHIENVTRRVGLKGLVRDCVVGYGLVQMIEFFLEQGFRGKRRHLRCALSRLRAVMYGALRARSYRLLIGPNHLETAEVLIDFLEHTHRPS